MQEVAVRTAEPLADPGHGLGIMEGAADGGAEFIGDGAFQEQRRALPGLGQDIHAAAGFGVAVRGVFDVHGHVVQQALVQQVPQNLGPGAVGVQLDGKAQGPDFADQVRKPRLERGLPAGEAHAVQPAPAAFQEVQHSPGLQGRLSPRQHQGPVVAERAAQLTAGKKHRRRHQTRIIQQRQLRQSADHHGPSPLSFASGY